MDEPNLLNEGIFCLNYKSMRWTGLSLNRNENIAYKCFQLVLYVLAVPSSVGALLTLSQNLNDTLRMLEHLALGCALLIGTIKLFSIVYIKEDLTKYLFVLNSEALELTINKLDKHKEGMLNTANRIVKFQFYMHHTYPILFLIFGNSPVLHEMIVKNGTALLPFGGFPIFNVKESPNYEIALIYQNVSLFVVYITYAASNCMLAAVLLYLDLQCQLLQHYIRTSLIPPEAIIQNNKLRWKQLKRNLKFLITRHNAIIDISQKFSKIFAFTNLVDFIGITIITGTSIAYGMLFNSYNFKFMQMATLGTSALVTDFVMSYWSSEFELNFGRIGNACYDINFIDTDTQVQKVLRMIIQRSQKPVQFTVGNFRPLNMETFIKVIKFAYSVLMVLRQPV